ncbi:hypothetical protein KR222_006595 [Zaprionus bogoriensis]|nr:hypothetical protein KR222_006595 [Zaprionus bogoriensis]
MAQGKRILLCLLGALCAAVCAEPGSYEHPNRHDASELEHVEGIIDVESTEPLEGTGPGKPLRLGKPSAGYADYDYYMHARRAPESLPGDNELSGSSPIRVTSNGNEPLRRPVDEMNVKPLPWYGPYTGKSIAMYPSRSYDPYIRRYDRFDEQYHRTYPQYFEDMYVHRQRFDPYDSYSPRVPQYPEPYLMYPDRQLDTPSLQARDYIKSRRGYLEESPALSPPLDAYSNKYAPSKLPLVAPRNERVVYYAHLPEIVRTPYDLSVTRPDRNAAASLVQSPSVPYKQNKKKLKSSLRADNSTNYKLSF